MEGGMVVTDDEELYHILLCLRSHGWTRNLPDTNLIVNKKLDNAFEESFNFVLPGYNLRPLEMSGAVGSKQLKKFPTFLKQRKENAEMFLEVMKDHDNIITQKETGSSSWFGFSIVIRPNSGLNRSDLVTRLEKIGFECRPIVAGNFANKKVVDYFDKEIHGNLENANWVNNNGLFIGNHHINMTEAFKELKKAFVK